MSRHSDEDAFAYAAAGVIMVVLGLMVILVVAMIFELVRVYAERSHADSPVAQPLRNAALAFVALLGGVALVSAAQPALAPVAMMLGAWGFLAFVIVVMRLDARARAQEEKDQLPLGQLETHLSPFASAGIPVPAAAPSMNGHHRPVTEPQI